MSDFEKITDTFVVVAQEEEVFDVVRWSTREIMLASITDFHTAWNAAYAMNHLTAGGDDG